MEDTEKIEYTKEMLEPLGGTFAYAMEQKTFGNEKLRTKNHILILSYNRPRMLSEAIESVLNQSYGNFHIRVIDDGSDYDVNDVISKFNDPRLSVNRWPPRSIDERKENLKLAEHLNHELKRIPGDEIVQYLCDDDIMGDDWLFSSTAALESNPEIHIALGKLAYFYDGNNYRTASFYGLPGRYDLSYMWWAFGNFAHRIGCWRDEGIRWRDNQLGHSQDVDFTWKMHEAHPTVIDIDLVALHKREHDKMLSTYLGRKDEQGNYRSDDYDQWTELPDEIFGEMME